MSNIYPNISQAEVIGTFDHMQNKVYFVTP